MLLVMCCYQISMLLLAMGVSVQMFEWQRKDRGVKKLVAPGLKWRMRCIVHTFVVDDQDHPQMIKICTELTRLSRLMSDWGYLPHTKLLLYDVEEEKVFHLPPCWETGYCIQAYQQNFWYSTLINRNLVGLWRLFVPQSSFQKYLGEQSRWGIPIAFITLRMVFVLAWIIGDASSLSFQ